MQIRIKRVISICYRNRKPSLDRVQGDPFLGVYGVMWPKEGQEGVGGEGERGEVRYLAGLLVQASRSSFPAATTTVIPALTRLCTARSSVY